ncbi:MAG: hypothetical protein HZA24_10295 [Nitrospirae bacterium]|nr:hypothetical protein [Nitrospirota bacterium]
MATVYYTSEGPHSAGNELHIDQVVTLFQGRPKMAIGLTPPALASAVSGQKPYAVVEIGPEEVRPPDFLDFGFYLVG